MPASANWPDSTLISPILTVPCACATEAADTKPEAANTKPTASAIFRIETLPDA